MMNSRKLWNKVFETEWSRTIKELDSMLFTTFSCDACGHQWKRKWTEYGIKCPKCKSARLQFKFHLCWEVYR